MNPFRLSTRLQPATRAVARLVSARAAPAPAPGDAPGDAAVRDRRATPDGVAADAAPAPGGAVAVPWVVTRRSASGVIEVEHRGSGPAHSARFALAGRGMLGLSLPRTVLPGERLRVALRGPSAEGTSAAADAMLVLRWFEPDGRELLWPIAL